MKTEKLFLKCEGDQLDIRCEAQAAELQLEIEAQDPNTKGPPPLPKFSMAAYNGGKMKVGCFRYPVVVDISGMSIPAQSVPIRLQHDSAQGVGHTTQIDMHQNTKITARGLISRSTPAANEVVDSGKKGFPWQASIGAAIHEYDFVPEDKTVRVNGQSFKGPVNVIKKSTLTEISFVDLGADTTSSATVAASAKTKESEPMNEFEKWLVAHGHEKAKLSAEKLGELQAAFDAEVAKAKADAEQKKIEASGDETAKLRASRAAELRRMAAIEKICAKNPDLAAQAIEAGWDESKAELEVMRAERAAWTKKAPNAIVAGGAEDALDNGVLEAAIFQSASNSNERSRFQKSFDDKTMQAAHTRWRGRISLQQLLLEAAWASGKFHGRSFDGYYSEVLQAAFSTFSLPGILSNNMNKFLLDSFNAVESTWRDIAEVRPVRDFKQASFYRLGGSMEYSKVGPHGELKSVSPSEVKYTSQAETYGAILSISRQDIINDDLGALSSAPRRLGRGAALKLNDVFWLDFLSNPGGTTNGFFSTSHVNYKSGAGSALSLTSLEAAAVAFRKQTDPDGKPLGYPPAVLLVSPENEVLAANLMRSQELRDTTASTKYPTSNVLAGRYKPVVSSYLSNTSLTNYSTTAWWLLADPANLAAIAACFLNGQEMPVVESHEAEFDTLGIRFRAFHDFGSDLQEYRAGIMSAGA